MTIFVDASAPVAVIAAEPGYTALERCIESSRLRLCSTVSAWETVAALCRSHGTAVDAAPLQIQVFKS